MSLWRRLLGRPGLGYFPDPLDLRDRLIGKLGLEAGPPYEWTLRHYVTEILDQGSTNSCVAHAWAQALRMADRIDGVPIPALDSRKFHYFNARAEHASEAFDLGTYLRTCAKGIMRFGRPMERHWPWEKPINRRPSWQAYRHAYDRRGPRGYYRIPQGDLDSLRRAIAAEKPVVFGISIPRSFTSRSGPSLIDWTSEASIGGHAMTVVGYEGELFEIANSWGTGWRSGGFAWVTSNWLVNARDLWAVDY